MKESMLLSKSKVKNLSQFSPIFKFIYFLLRLRKYFDYVGQEFYDPALE